MIDYGDSFMKVLVIVGDCLTVNSSANLCHLAYISGLVDCGYQVTIVSADSDNYSHDRSMTIPSGTKSYFYDGITLYEKLAKKKSDSVSDISTETKSDIKNNTASIRSKVINVIKSGIISLYGPHGVYSKIVKTAQKFRSDEEYDYVLSISTPPSGHLLAHNLLKAKHIKAKHWIQIWEDPWYGDAYGFNGKDKIFLEEKRLLSYAEKVCYVSPITLINRQKLFPESAEKMFWQPLPYYYKNTAKTNQVQKNLLGYFGFYYPKSRDLEPFYNSCAKHGFEVNICGEPYQLFDPEDSIHIYPRLSLDKLKPFEDKTDILVFLCNRKGGQIPGKIYQYSATYKTILFILDGTDEEKKVLKEYFQKFNRYVFCENTVEDITRAINDIESGNIGNVVNEPIEAFNPKETVRKILACENG